MLILSFDPGATRAGWSVIRLQDGKRTYLDSGIVACPRGDSEPFQAYRERLLRHWVTAFEDIGDTVEDAMTQTSDRELLVVFEIVPAIGFKSGGAVQSQLAQVVATACQTLCEEWGWQWSQISATSVKKAICGFGDGTKAQVRDGVLAVFPELEPRRKELTSVADEADAIAIGIASSGYKVAKPKGKNPRRKGKKNG